MNLFKAKRRTQNQKQIKPFEPLKIMKCNICEGDAQKVFVGKILNKYEIEYFFCNNCEHLQTQQAFWLEEAYNDAITASDTGIMQRNLMFRELVSNVIYKLFDKDAKFVDFAGGYGIFTRLMRDVGFDFYRSDKYAPNLAARGFDYNEGEKVELLCAFEAIEHFLNPLAEFEKMFEISDNVLISQTFLPYPVPLPEEWWYYGLEHGQHINFYSRKTLEFIAEKFNKKFCSYQDLHLFTSKKITAKAFKKAVKKNSFEKIKSDMHSRTLDDMNFIISQKINKI
ncbi:MAG: class I SAM-dependent methyltransferase [Candidatus Gastranaerophilales bacterium]|nr:class I SAM-dependent methyltransferase [Candidatus Gastranaerophilales bacterium]